jgi:hypothetical protein
MCKYEVDIPEYVDLVEACDKLMEAWKGPQTSIYNELLELEKALSKVKD